MKKLKSFGVAAVAALLLTSCLDGNREQTLSGYGVIDLSMDVFANVAYVDDNLPIYSSQFKDLAAEDCITFTCTIDYDDPENNGGKYLKGTNTIVYGKLDKGDLIRNVDTANIKENEMVIVDAGLVTKSAYAYTIKDFLFVGSNHDKVTTDQNNQYFLECDPYQEPQIVDGKRVYNLFLRVVKSSDGKGIAGNHSFNYVFKTNGLFKNLEAREKTEGNNTLYIKLNYIKAFNSDSTVATWTSSQVFQSPIYTEATTN